MKNWIHKHIKNICTMAFVAAGISLSAQDVSADSLFDVRSLSGTNPFSLAMPSPSPGASAQGHSGFLVDTAYRAQPFIPPVSPAEAWGQAVAPEDNVFAFGSVVTDYGQAEAPPAPEAQEVVGAAASAEPSKGVNPVGGWLFYVLLVILAYLTMIVSVYRQEVYKLFGAFSNINMAVQVFRDKGPFLSFHDFLLYLLFVMTGGSLAYMAALLNGAVFPIAPYYALLLCMLGVGLIYILKHLQLGIISAIFPFGAETSFYSFLIGNSNKTLGILLVPMVFCVAYTPEALRMVFLWLTIGLCSLVYLYQTFRALANVGNYILFHKFHFFMYLCAVEIAPVLILIKLLSRNGF